MKRHSRQHVYEQRLRAPKRWGWYRRWLQRDQDRIALDAALRGYPWNAPDWIGQDGRFVKYTRSCACGTCLADRRDHKFRTHKKAFYRQLDRLAQRAWE